MRRSKMLAEMLAITTEMAARQATMDGLLATLVTEVGALASIAERQATELARLADRVTVIEAAINGHDAAEVKS